MRTKKSAVSDSTNSTNSTNSTSIKTDYAKASFALDIGTRSVVGILGFHDNGTYHVVDSCQLFHAERAMRDGQIENINLVAEVVKQIKETFEKRHKITLSSVSIAAAGRALKTKRVTYEQELDFTEEISLKLMQAIEYCALGIAQAEYFAEDATADDTSFYCVGYSIISYRLDDYALSTLVGHKGKKAQVELIAAFLPQNVVQSLYSVTSKNQLSVNNLTLEPIAAINVIVPKDIRLLNLALVDIGAGTSDIAISKNGSIIAYDMVTVAGDEITESIMRHCLCDFATAEDIKAKLAQNGDDLQFTDILGNVKKDKKSLLSKAIKPSLATLAEAIASKIIDINDEPPMAVFLVGGGSQTPGLCKELARLLKLPCENVSISGKQPFKNITLYSDALQNPEYITPIGIGALSCLYKGCNFFSVTINDKKIMLLNNGTPKVMDALLLSSIKPQSLIGKSSRTLIYYLNGERIIKRGNSAAAGKIYLNGTAASIDTAIAHGDEIKVTPATDGEPICIRIRDIKNAAREKDAAFAMEFYKKGKKLKDSYIIQPMDDIATTADAPAYVATPDTEAAEATLAQEVSAISEPALAQAPSPKPDAVFTPSDAPPTAQIQPLSSNNMAPDPAQIQPSPSLPQTEPTPTHDAESTAATTTENTLPSEPAQNAPLQTQAEAHAEASEASVYTPLPLEQEIKVCINDRWKYVNTDEKGNAFFFDALNFVNIDFQKPQGNIVLLLNGSPASYTDPLKQGDTIEIYWDNEKN